MANETVYFYEVVGEDRYMVAAFDEESARALYAEESELSIDEFEVTAMDMDEIISWGFVHTSIEPVMKEYSLRNIACGLNPNTLPFSFNDFGDIEINEDNLFSGDKIYE